jgi:hypothetical protein
MKNRTLAATTAAVLTAVTTALAVTATSAEVAECSFDGSWSTVPVSGRTNLPPWLSGVQQSGGVFSDQPACWRVAGDQPVGRGRLSLLLDRSKLSEDVALSVLYDGGDESDLAVQLFDAEDRAIVLDLFGNLFTVGREARTDTFIVPLRKYPSATRIALRRIRGDIKVYGLALYPVVAEAQADPEALEQLRKLLGDPLSPDNPLRRATDRIARERRLQLEPAAPEAVAQAQESRTKWAQRSDTVSLISAQPDFWDFLPIPKGDSWAGSGKSGDCREGVVVLRGWYARSQKTFRLPLVIESNLQVENGGSPDPAFYISLVPAGASRNEHPRERVSFVVGHRDIGREDDTFHILLERETQAEGFSKTLLEPAFTWRRAQSYRVRIELTASGLQARLGDRTYEARAGIVPFERFHIQLRGWQTSHTWRVAEFSVH